MLRALVCVQVCWSQIWRFNIKLIVGSAFATGHLRWRVHIECLLFFGEAGVKDPTTWGYWPSQAGSPKKESFENMLKNWKSDFAWFQYNVVTLNQVIILFDLSLRSVFGLGALFGVAMTSFVLAPLHWTFVDLILSLMTYFVHSKVLRDSYIMFFLHTLVTWRKSPYGSSIRSSTAAQV